jgi:SAM-dependent methyltransferase
MARFSIMGVYGFLQTPFRKRRLRLFQDVLQPNSQVRILDMGGSPWFWNDLAVSAKITILNPDRLSDDLLQRYSQFEYLTADGCSLPYADKSFDVGFSNSAIEHVGTYERQRAFASELRRVGRTLWVQTPAWEFPVEPHLIAPLFQYFPRWLQRRTLRYFTVFGLMTKPTPAQVEGFLNEVRLLKFHEMQELFPDCEIHREKVLGLTKSYIAIRKHS